MNQNEEKAFGAAMAIFPSTNRIKIQTVTLIFYTSTSQKPCPMNQMPAIYTVLCDCQMFQVNFGPFLVPE